MKFQDRDEQNFHEAIKVIEKPEWIINNESVDVVAMQILAAYHQIKRGEKFEVALSNNGVSAEQYQSMIDNILHENNITE